MKKLIAAALLIFSGANFLNAQTQDFGMWNTISVNKEFNKKLSAGIDQEIRFRDNLSTLNLVYTNVGLTYKLSDNFKFSAVYRFIDKHKDDFTWGVRHRIYFDAAVKVKPGNFNFSYRARYQIEWRGAGYEQIHGNVPEIYFRNLFKLGYKVGESWEPYLGSEIRFQIQNPRIPYHNGFDRTRFIGGLNYELNKHHTIGTYFLYQKEWNVSDPETLHILGIEYTFNI
ncbi:MAG: hypothetical protein RL007_336 [Bacteroidota bacterium]|jgi:hypothetical protein